MVLQTSLELQVDNNDGVSSESAHNKKIIKLAKYIYIYGIYWFIMIRDSTRDLRKMDRRSFIKNLASLGVSSTVLRHMSAEDLENLTDHPKDEVPRLKMLVHKDHDSMEPGNPPERKPIYYTIPRDHWEIIEATNTAARSLKGQINRSGIDKITVGMAPRKNNGQLQHRTEACIS